VPAHSPARRSSRTTPAPAPLHRVHVQGHDVARWRVRQLRLVVPAADVPNARLAGVREAHRRADVPPMRSLIRQSWPFSSAWKAV